MYTSIVIIKNLRYGFFYTAYAVFMSILLVFLIYKYFNEVEFINKYGSYSYKYGVEFKLNFIATIYNDICGIAINKPCILQEKSKLPNISNMKAMTNWTNGVFGWIVLITQWGMALNITLATAAAISCNPKRHGYESIPIGKYIDIRRRLINIIQLMGVSLFLYGMGIWVFMLIPNILSLFEDDSWNKFAKIYANTASLYQVLIYVIPTGIIISFVIGRFRYCNELMLKNIFKSEIDSAVKTIENISIDDIDPLYKAKENLGKVFDVNLFRLYTLSIFPALLPIIFNFFYVTIF